MAVVKATDEEIKLLARLMRAEAEGEGNQGMLMVGNVGINRVRARCDLFRNVTTIKRMVTMHPGGFEATLHSYFYQPARNNEIKLAKRCIKGEKFYPASNALWFYSTKGGCRASLYGAWNTGKYKRHCFYTPTKSMKCY